MCVLRYFPDSNTWTAEFFGSVKASLFVTVEPVTCAVLTGLCFKTKFVLPDIIGFVLILGAIEVVSVITFKEKK